MKHRRFALFELIPSPTRDWILRWREVLAGIVVMLFGLWWWWNTYAFVSWMAVVVMLTGAALVWTGAERLRFRQGGGGAGMVEIDERRLSYFGPLTGGVIDMDDLIRLSLDPTGRPAHWILTAAGGQSLSIPVNAEGADNLFDVFAALPGIRTEQMLDVLARLPAEPVMIWQRSNLRLH
jgi:hypothetical protein